MGKIICYGESLIDFTYENNAFTPHPGGSPYNVAIALSRLGVTVEYISKLSHDLFGDMLNDYLINNNVLTTHINRVNAPSTLAFVKTQIDHEPEYAFYSNQAADVMLKTDDLPKNLDASIHHFGSISLMQEPCGTVLEDYITTLNGFVSFDPNIRASLIPDRKKYLERFYHILASTQILRMSVCDFEWLFPDQTMEQFIQQTFAQQKVQLIAITSGEGGASIYTPEHRLHQVAANICVADTIGAGDTFTAGLLSVLVNYVKDKQLQGLNQTILQHAIQVATIAAAINCSRKGANPPVLKEVETFVL